MELKFRCGECNRKLEASATMAGSVVCCPSCGASVTIPQALLGPGVTLAGFRIEKEIGRGAMGRVFLATQIAMERKVALKVLPSPRVADSEYVERFFHEVRLAARLAHPNIVSAFDAGEDHGYYYFAMEFIDGESLDSHIKRAGPVPEKEAVAYALGVAEALAHAWTTSRILHRDVKPANIMVDAERRPMLMDMGIAKNVGEESHLTATGVAVGTPHYMSPEQARGSQDLDFRTDVYSLGASLFHLVSGRVPFIGTSAVEVITKHLHDPVPSVRSLKPDVSQECEDIILRMMAKDRVHRFSTWEACIHDLQALLKGKTPETTKAKLAKQASESLAQQRAYNPMRSLTATRPTAQQWVLVGTAAALGLAALIVAVVLLWRESRAAAVRPGPPPPRPPAARPAVAVAQTGEPSGQRTVPERTETNQTDHARAAPSATPATVPLRQPPGPAPAGSAVPSPAAAKAAGAAARAGEMAAAAPAQAAQTPPTPEAPADPLAAALRPVAAHLVAGRPGPALAAWDHAAVSLRPALPTSRLAEVRAMLACVNDTEQHILDSFRGSVGQPPFTLRLKEGPRRVQVRAVTPPTVRIMVLVENGATGATITVGDLDPAEKLARLAKTETPEAALARGLVALWEQQHALAEAALKRFDTPLTRAVSHALEERAAEQRELTAEKAYEELLQRQSLRLPVPQEPERLARELRERLDSPKRRKAFEDRLKAYEVAHGNTAVGRERVSTLRAILVYPFVESAWTVPTIGMEFAWIGPLSCWAGVHEVTNAQFRCLVTDHNSATAHGRTLNDDEQPAVWLSFEDAEGYAALLTNRERHADRLPHGFRYRLPRADEWTILAACGDSRKFPWGDTWPPPAEVNYNGSEWPGPEGTGISGHEDPYPVSCLVSKSGHNAWGLFGLAGNAMEWTGGADGTSPELRGNAWCGLGGHPSQSAYTVASAWARPSPNFRTEATGMRLLLAPEPKPRTGADAPPR
jgi:serine/threonine-protein kinase